MRKLSESGIKTDPGRQPSCPPGPPLFLSAGRAAAVLFVLLSIQGWGLHTFVDVQRGSFLSVDDQLLSTSVINNFGHVTSFTPHEGQAAGYTITDSDSFGRPERLAWENGMDILFNNYTFNGPLEIVGVDGSPSSISYNQVGLVDTVSGTLGTVDFEYNPLGIQTKATSTAGGQSHVMQQNVDALARLKDVTGPLGTTTFTPGDNGTASISFPDQATLSHSISGFGQSATTGNALPAPTFRSVEPNGNGFEISSGLGSAATSERKIETQFDLLGRITSSSAPGQGVTSFEKNPDGTIKRVSHSSGYATRLEYNEHKEPTQSGLDLDNNGELDLLGSDRLTSVDIQRGSFSLSSPISEDGSKAISIAGTIDPMGLSGSLQQNNRSSTWSTGPITSGGDFDRTTTDSSGISTTSEYDNWRLTKRTTHGFDGSQILVEDFDYKPLGQLELYTAIPGGQIEYRYDSKFRMYETVSRLLDANGAIVAGSERIATTHFESDHTTRPDTINQTAKPTLDLEINKANQVMSATGGELIPREYQYDHGALSEIHTQRDGDPQQTVFHYHDNGQFDRKEINGALQHQVVYDGNGIARHIDGPRGRTSLHRNDATGDLLGLSYHPTDSSSTAPVDYHDFDRQGVPHRITYDGTERILDTTVYGEIHHESVSYPGGEASAVDRVFDEASGWLDASTCTTPGATDTTVYTPRGDYSIESIDYGDTELTYHYHPHFRSVSGFDLDDQGQVALRRRELLTPLGQIEHIVYSNAVAELGRISYTYHPGSRRIASKTLLDGRRWEYQYDPDSGALKSAELFAPGGTTPIDARYYEYDSLGNRTELGDLVQAKSYQLNADNQVTGSLHLAETSVQGWLDPASGLNWSNVEIRVDGQSVTWTNGVFTYLVPVVATNASATSRTLRITALVESNGTQACVAVIERTIAQPKGLGIARYSSVGELESDGLYKYEWNMRGELRQATSLEAGWRKRLRFHYLDNGKLWKYEVEQEDGAGTWQAIRTHRYDYDCWNVVEERVTDAAGQVTRKRHLWGLDLAGQAGGQQAAMQRAGGVGGLLGTVVTVGNGPAEFQPVLLDHLGSVEGRLVDGQLVKHFYGPYGIPEAGPGAEAGYGYSTKPYIPELGLYYYGYRFYSPRTGRWISRDPIQEDGGLNLYGFVGNDPVNAFDYLGMDYFMVANGISTWVMEDRNTGELIGYMPIGRLVGGDVHQITLPGFEGRYPASDLRRHIGKFAANNKTVSFGKLPIKSQRAFMAAWFQQMFQAEYARGNAALFMESVGEVSAEKWNGLKSNADALRYTDWSQVGGYAREGIVDAHNARADRIAQLALASASDPDNISAFGFARAATWGSLEGVFAVPITEGVELSTGDNLMTGESLTLGEYRARAGGVAQSLLYWIGGRYVGGKSTPKAGNAGKAHAYIDGPGQYTFEYKLVPYEKGILGWLSKRTNLRRTIITRDRIQNNIDRVASPKKWLAVQKHEEFHQWFTRKFPNAAVFKERVLVFGSYARYGEEVAARIYEGVAARRPYKFIASPVDAFGSLSVWDWIVIGGTAFGALELSD